MQLRNIVSRSVFIGLLVVGALTASSPLSWLHPSEGRGI
jgi:hypothetical protein